MGYGGHALDMIMRLKANNRFPIPKIKKIDPEIVAQWYFGTQLRFY